MARRKLKPYFDDETREDRYIRNRREAIEVCKPIWAKAKILQRVAAGKAKEGVTSATPESVTASPVSMSEVSVIISTASGRQMMRRFEREYVPRSPAHDAWAEVMTKADKALSQSAEFEIYESQAFRDGPLISGVSWMQFNLDFLEDKEGRMTQRDIPVWEMLWDPGARDVNLVDRRWHSWGSWWSIEDCKRRFPDSVQELAAMRGRVNSGWDNQADGSTQSVRIPWEEPGFQTAPKLWNRRMRSVWIERMEEWDLDLVYDVLVPVDPSLTMDQLGAMAGGEMGDPFQTQEMDKAGWVEFKRDRLARLGEEVPDAWATQRYKKVWRYAYFCGDYMLEEGDIPTGYWTHLAMVGDRVLQPDACHFQSLLERLVDAQSFVNLLLTALLRDIMMNPKGVLVVEEGVFRNKSEAQREWTAPGGVITVPRGRLSGNPPYKYEAGGTGAYSSKVSQLLDFWREAIPRLAGFNPASLGQLGTDLRRVSGEVVRQLQDDAMVSNAGLFQSFSFYRREAGRVVTGMMRELFGENLPGLIRLVGDDVAFRDIYDPTTGEVQIDPTTGEAMREMVIPPVEMWNVNAWREVAIGETEPTEDFRRSLWTSLTESGGLQVMQTPWPEDTLISGEDVITIMPSLTPRLREKMKQEWKKVVARRNLQKMVEQQMMMAQMQQAAAPQQPPAQAAA